MASGQSSLGPLRTLQTLKMSVSCPSGIDNFVFSLSFFSSCSLLHEIKRTAGVKVFLLRKYVLHSHESTIRGEVGMRHSSWLGKVNLLPNSIRESRRPLSDLLEHQSVLSVFMITTYGTSYLEVHYSDFDVLGTFLLENSKKFIYVLLHCWRRRIRSFFSQ